MNAAQLVRALGQAAKLTGVDTSELLALEDRATLVDARDLALEVADRIDLALPVAERAPPRPTGRPAGGRHTAQVAELAAAGHPDTQIGAQLGLSAEAVRSIRRRSGIAPGQGPEATQYRPSGARDRVAELHAQGMSTDEIAAETGLRRGSVQTYLSEIRRAAREG